MNKIREDSNKDNDDMLLSSILNTKNSTIKETKKEKKLTSIVKGGLVKTGSIIVKTNQNTNSITNNIKNYNLTMLKEKNLNIQDVIFNKMHIINNNRGYKNTNDTLKVNNNIKYVMYKNEKKEINKYDLFFDEYIKSPNSFRSKSMHGILKLDENYQKYKNNEKQAFVKFLNK